jgi:TMEM175 potassium channel family protein
MPEEDRQAKRWDTGRVEAFSDGVFAIAITLLVLEISVDPSDFDHLGKALLDEWPSYLAYVTSFLTVGGLWIAHHNLFTRLRFVDPVLLRLNLFLLLAVAFLPFPTGVLAEAFHASQDAERAAVVFYGITAAIIELMLAVAVRYAVSRPELVEGELPDLPPSARERGRWGALGAALYGLAILAGLFIFPRIGAVAYLIVALRSVVVVGGEGRLSISGLRPRRSRG